MQLTICSLIVFPSNSIVRIFWNKIQHKHSYTLTYTVAILYILHRNLILICTSSLISDLSNNVRQNQKLDNFVILNTSQRDSAVDRHRLRFLGLGKGDKEVERTGLFLHKAR